MKFDVPHAQEGWCHATTNRTLLLLVRFHAVHTSPSHSRLNSNLSNVSLSICNQKWNTIEIKMELSQIFTICFNCSDQDSCNNIFEYQTKNQWSIWNHHTKNIAQHRPFGDGQDYAVASEAAPWKCPLPWAVHNIHYDLMLYVHTLQLQVSLDRILCGTEITKVHWGRLPTVSFEAEFDSVQAICFRCCASINHLPPAWMFWFTMIYWFTSLCSGYSLSSPSPGFPRDRHLLEFRWCIGQLRCHLETKDSKGRSIDLIDLIDVIHLCHEWMQCEMLIVARCACARNASSTTGLFLLWSYLRTRSLKPSSLL